MKEFNAEAAENTEKKWENAPQKEKGRNGG
jgi:hypothetical protein